MGIQFIKQKDLLSRKAEDICLVVNETIRVFIFTGINKNLEQSKFSS